MTVAIELFYSPMCLYCPKAKKILMEIAEEFGGEIQVEEINVLSPAGLEKAEEYGIKGVPSIILNNKAKITGVPTVQQLRKAIQRELDRVEKHACMLENDTKSDHTACVNTSKRNSQRWAYQANT